MERYLRDALDSVTSQSYSPIECIVVDDGSSDGTASVARSYGDRVHLVGQENAGVSAARNNGAAIARGELLAFLDADDVWMPDRLSRQVPLLVNDGRAVAAICAATIVDQQLRKVRVLRTHPTPTPETMLMRAGTLSVGGSGLLIKADSFKAIEGFDEALSVSADWDLLMRVVQRSSLAYTDEPLYLYRLRESGMSRNVQGMEHDMRIAYRKAFNSLPELRPLRRRAYGRLHWMLAGSYWNTHRRGLGVRHTCRALTYDPTMFVRLFRRLARGGGSQQSLAEGVPSSRA
jgi:glycosyltransferase involved in cell wall biosynthesis